MRHILVAGLVGLALVATSTLPSLAQRNSEITGKTCRELIRSCIRICAIHQGEPAWQGCGADCSRGHQTCRSTGTWQSKNATIKVPDDASTWSRRQWNAATAKWALEKDKWAGCQSQAKTNKLSRGKSRTFLQACMTK